MSEQLHQAKDVYLDMCSRALFLASKAVTPQGGFDDLQAISIIKVSLEADHGAYLGAGLTRTLLEGFPEGERLGWGMIILNDDLGLHHSELAKWEKSYWVYGEHTAYGHLILAGTIDNFVRWAASMPCRKEVAGVRSGRLFAYIRHPNDPKFTHPGRGFIVYVDAQGGTAAATVANGYGYGIFASGSHYEGELKVRAGRHHRDAYHSACAPTHAAGAITCARAWHAPDAPPSRTTRSTASAPRSGRTAANTPGSGRCGYGGLAARATPGGLNTPAVRTRCPRSGRVSRACPTPSMPTATASRATRSTGQGPSSGRTAARTMASGRYDGGAERWPARVGQCARRCNAVTRATHPPSTPIECVRTVDTHRTTSSTAGARTTGQMEARMSASSRCVASRAQRMPPALARGACPSPHACMR